MYLTHKMVCFQSKVWSNIDITKIVLTGSAVSAGYAGVADIAGSTLPAPPTLVRRRTDTGHLPVNVQGTLATEP